MMTYNRQWILEQMRTGRLILDIVRDYQGSINQIWTKDGKIIQDVLYDPWGRICLARNYQLCSTSNEPKLILGRGYTGHEHLQEHGLIHMNARLYDPYIGRFLSPDPYVQMPDFSQNFNRYSYCLNNPLRYNDLTGEWFGIDDLLISGIGFAAGYLSHGISSGNWGWKAVAAGVTSAVSSWLSYNTGGMATGNITGSTWSHAGGMAMSAVSSQFMPSTSIPITKNFGLSISPGLGFGTNGLTGGMNIGGVYSSGRVTIGAGIGFGTNHWGWSTSAAYKGWGAGYGKTYYDASTVMGHDFESQKVGTITGYFNHNSFSISNDLWGDKGDRQRTSAAELTIGKWSVGTYLYTNDGKMASNEATDESDNCVPPWPVGKNKNEGLSTWRNGRVYFAPAWIGYRSGNQVTRIGLSHQFIHNITQNLVHKGFGKQNYYMMYDEFKSGGYFYSGYNNPLSLWER